MIESFLSNFIPQFGRFTFSR